MVVPLNNGLAKRPAQRQQGGFWNVCLELLLHFSLDSTEGVIDGLSMYPAHVPSFIGQPVDIQPKYFVLKFAQNFLDIPWYAATFLDRLLKSRDHQLCC